MTERARRMMFTGLLCATCAGLVGCGAQIDESLLNAQADYSIDISLPYATVTPPPAQQQEEVQALVIDAEGGVTVNDSSSILGGSVDADSAVGNYKSLRQGNTGLAVQALQTRLQELGYYAQDVSGIFDAETEAAVRRSSRPTARCRPAWPPRNCRRACSLRTRSSTPATPTTRPWSRNTAYCSAAMWAVRCTRCSSACAVWAIRWASSPASLTTRRPTPSCSSTRPTA